MDYNEREAQRRQEDRDLNRALIWVGAAIVLEFLLVLVNKYYINFRTTPESINLALAISAALNGLRWVSLAALAACVVWTALRLKQGGQAGLQLSLAAVSTALYFCAQITLVFQESGVRTPFWISRASRPGSVRYAPAPTSKRGTIAAPPGPRIPTPTDTKSGTEYSAPLFLFPEDPEPPV